MSQQQRQQVDSLLAQLGAAGRQQQPRPLDNPLLYGNYNVAYTSTLNAPSERGQRKQTSIFMSGLRVHCVFCLIVSKVTGSVLPLCVLYGRLSFYSHQLLEAGSGVASGGCCSRPRVCFSLCWSLTLPQTR